MKTIIAEKPSVAREIARIVGATKREEGYFEGGGYAVTWAFGHLVQLAMPDGYGVRGFVRDNLPIIPDTFTLVPRQVRTEKGYKPDSGVVSQIKVIKRLFDTSEHIIVATQAFALRTGASYIGVVGSRRKTKYVREKLEAQGFTGEQLDSVYAPIGIEIGSETPAEIAISIAAQLIQIRSAKTGKRKGAHPALHT